LWVLVRPRRLPFYCSPGWSIFLVTGDAGPRESFLFQPVNLDHFLSFPFSDVAREGLLAPRSFCSVFLIPFLLLLRHQTPPFFFHSATFLLPPLREVKLQGILFVLRGPVSRACTVPFTCVRDVFTENRFFFLTNKAPERSVSCGCRGNSLNSFGTKFRPCPILPSALLLSGPNLGPLTILWLPRH